MYHVVANRLTCYSAMSAHCYINTSLINMCGLNKIYYTFYQLQNIKSV